MVIVVIDGMGGGIGAQIVSRLKQELKEDAELIALGTNAVATDRMVRAGAARGATGENAIRVSIGLADYLVAPIGVVIPDSMMGEITAGIAGTVFGSRAKKLLIPIVHQHFTIVGLEQKPVSLLIAEAVELIRAELASPGPSRV
jgi:hypothetical protein